MSVLAVIGVPAQDFTFGGTLTINPGLHVRLERVVPLGSTFIPYVWAKDDSVDAIEAALRAEDDIESFRIVDTVDGEALIRVEWVRDLDGLLDVMAETGATILEGEGGSDTWTFQLRFDDREDLTAFYQQCAEREISIDLKRVHNPGVRADAGAGLDLTKAQRKTLQHALERGYFEVPRGITITELAADLGVSDTAVSQRIRRGLTTLLLAILDEPDSRSRRR
jgi:predicted DNA binding protein